MKVSVDKTFRDALPDGIICLDDNFHCLWWNVAANDLLPLIQHGNVQQLFSLPEVDELFHQLHSNAVELKSPFDTNRWLTLMLRPYHESQWLLIVRDVTHTHLLDTIRKDFIANVSHELRTPLTVFHGYLEILQDMHDVPTAQLKDMLRQMSSQSLRMQSLVQDLLLLSRLESVEPDTSEHVAVNVAGMLRSICDDAEKLACKKNLTITRSFDKDLEIKGQSEELFSAFSNIIFNAVHYTPDNGHITVRWFYDENHYVFSVKDDGVGIAKEDIPKLTQRFYRTDKARLRHQVSEGTGLGLAIVKHVMLRHHGELVIESTLGQGSEFFCNFPKVS